MKGFKDKDKKFHPIKQGKGVRKRRFAGKPLDYKDPELIRHAGIEITESMLKTGRRFKKDQILKSEGVKVNSGVRMKKDKKNTDGSMFKQIKVWRFNDASDDLQEKIIEKWRENISGQDTFYAEDEGILYDTKEMFAGHDVFTDVIPKFWDLDPRNKYIQFDLDVKDEKKLAKYLGIPEKLRVKIDFKFKNEGDDNTRLVFIDIMGNEVDLSDDVHSFDDDNNFFGVAKDDKPTLNEFRLLLQAHDKWADLMDKSLNNLQLNFDDQFHEETIKDTIEANNFTFNSSGEIENI